MGRRGRRWAIGKTHPAIDNPDADPAGEIVVGSALFNPPANSGGWFLVIDNWGPTPNSYADSTSNYCDLTA